MERAETVNLQRDFLRQISDDHRRIFVLKMAPMIDMIFLLLIFFLVTAKGNMPEQFLPMLQAVHAEGQLLIKPEPLTMHVNWRENGCEISIGSAETVTINADTIDLDMTVMIEKINKVMRSQKRYACDPVEIICENSVRWEYLAKIYNLLYGAKITDITFTVMENELN